MIQSLDRSTATATPGTTVPSPPSKHVEPTRRIVLRGVGGGDYLAQLRIVGDRPIRVTYDRGLMEVWMPSPGHELDAHNLGRIIDAIVEARDIPMKPGRLTTHRREDLDRGVEPDNCYWLGANADLMIGKHELDLTLDPPPDLVVEVDVTSSVVPRLPIFAALGVPEVWRVILGELRFLQLSDDGSYPASMRSRAFPIRMIEDLKVPLERASNESGTAWIRDLREEFRPRDQVVGP